jgi:hypothetical protein
MKKICETCMPLGEFKHRYCFKHGWLSSFNSASHPMGPAPTCLRITASTAYRETYQMIPLSTRLFSHWSIPLIINTVSWIRYIGLGFLQYINIYSCYNKSCRRKYGKIVEWTGTLRSTQHPTDTQVSFMIHSFN